MQRAHPVPVVHPQAVRLRKFQHACSQLRRAEPAALWIFNAATARLHAAAFAHFSRVNAMRQRVRQGEIQHLVDFRLALFIPAKLRHAAPVFIETDRQRVIEPAREGKGRREEGGQRGVMMA